MLKPNFYVAPMEEMDTVACGKKRLIRVVKASHQIQQDFIEMAKSDKEMSQFNLLIPIVAEESFKMLERLEEDQDVDKVAGVMLFGGQTMGLAAKHECVKDIKKSPIFQSGNRILVSHQNQNSVVETLILATAGIDVFQSDYALDIALKGKALIFNPDVEIRPKAK